MASHSYNPPAPLSLVPPPARAAAAPFRSYALLGESPAVRRLRSQVQRIAPYFRTALIRGEAGTGKQLVARSIHALSPAAEGPFIIADAPALAESLAERQGASAASALLESVAGGTLFLDAIGEVPYAQQATLLHFLDASEERRPANISLVAEPRRPVTRILAATHRDLRTAAAIGQFRPELYARLSTVEILVPPLRQRTEDLTQIAAGLLRAIAHKQGHATRTPTPAAMLRLQRHAWPGNLRELKRVLVQAASTAASDRHHDPGVLAPEHLLTLTETAASTTPSAAPPVERLHDVMHQHVLKVLTHCAGNKLRAAELLGISRSTLYRMLESSAA
jgi:DNA-binding NtrC family response regulator